MILVWITLLSYLIQICYGSVLIDCNNKGFICYDRTRFYQCVEIGNSTFVIGSPQECPPGLICDDLSDLECDEPENIPTTKRTTRTTQTTPGTTTSRWTNGTSAGTSTIAPTSASTRRSTSRETTETEPTSTPEEISTSTTNSETSESETSAGTSTIAPTSASTRRSTSRETTETEATSTPEEISTSTTNSETSESETSAATISSTPTPNASSSSTPISSTSGSRTTTDIPTTVPDCTSTGSATHVETTTETQTHNTSTTESRYPSTSQTDFTCYNVGKYPDPQSCTKFHVCVNAIFGLIDVPYDCPDGTQYDSVNQECTIDPVQCPWEPQLECQKAGIYKNPYYCGRYYRCTWRYAYNRYEIKQFRCPDFTEFNQEMGKCVKSETCQQNPTDFQCIQAGKFPVQENCKEYYECTRKGEGYVEKRKSCPLYQLFDRNLGRCRNECLVKCPVDDEETEIVEGKVFLKELLSRE